MIGRMPLRLSTTPTAVGALLLAAGCAPPTAGPPVVWIPLAPQAPPEPVAVPSERPEILGHWEGVGVQDSDTSWKMVVDIFGVGPGFCGRARYPSIPCAGAWICSGHSDGRALRARQRITEGHDACIDAGEMTMSLTPEGTLSWSWTGSGENAHAVLSRHQRR
jgi:hypothetical protein